MTAATPSLRDVLGRPERLPALTPAQWDVVLRQARAGGLAGHLYYVMEQQGWSGPIPAAVSRHLAAARIIADKLAQDIEREVLRVVEPLLLADIPVIALKGAAYILGDLAVAQGRVFDDIDILVPREHLDVAERRLIGAGWRGEEKSSWDQRFYRRWMHQIPPMVHTSRDSIVDLHFAIVPNLARQPVASEPLFEAAEPTPRHPPIKILAPCDMVLHAAVHLFNDSEFDQALRNLVDLDLLLRQFSSTPGFWSALLNRAAFLGTGRPLFYALRYTSRFLSTPVPSATLATARQLAPPMPALMDVLFDRALRPPHATARDCLSESSNSILYLRGQWLRLPSYLLVPHLLRSFVVHRLASLSAPEDAG